MILHSLITAKITNEKIEDMGGAPVYFPYLASSDYPLFQNQLEVILKIHQEFSIICNTLK